MFDDGGRPGGAGGCCADRRPAAGWLAALAGVDLGVDHGLDDADRVEQIGLLEQLKAAAAAAQAVLTVELVASQRAEQQAAGVPASRLGHGVAAQVGLARRESPHRGSQHVGLAQALTTRAAGDDGRPAGRRDQ